MYAFGGKQAEYKLQTCNIFTWLTWKLRPAGFRNKNTSSLPHPRLPVHWMEPFVIEALWGICMYWGHIWPSTNIAFITIGHDSGQKQIPIMTVCPQTDSAPASLQHPHHWASPWGLKASMLQNHRLTSQKKEKELSQFEFNKYALPHVLNIQCLAL